MCLLLGHNRYRSLSWRQHTTILFTSLALSQCVWMKYHSKRGTSLMFNCYSSVWVCFTARCVCPGSMGRHSHSQCWWIIPKFITSAQYFPASCLKEESSRRIAVMYSGWPPLSEETGNQPPFFFFFVLFFNPHQRGAKGETAFPRSPSLIIAFWEQAHINFCHPKHHLVLLSHGLVLIHQQTPAVPPGWGKTGPVWLCCRARGLHPRGSDTN